MTKFITLIMVVNYGDEEWFNIVFMNSAKHLKLKIFNFQRVKKSRRTNCQEPRVRTTAIHVTAFTNFE